MKFDFGIQSRLNVASGFAFALFAFMLLSGIPAAHAQEDADRANNVLENLKRRSAEDRWQRIKRLYPTEPAISRPRNPSLLPDGHQAPMTANQLPPSPEQTQLIPRLSALPADASNDWVLPNQKTFDQIDDPLPAVVPSPTPVEQSATSSVRPSRAPVSVAAQDANSKSLTDELAALNTPHVVRERKISDINPYYDRERDNDMREFTVEKSKEFDFAIKSTQYSERSFPQIALAWEPSNFYFYPLYFADPALERYGHTYNPVIQPLASIARAGMQFAFLPYQMVIDPPCREVSSLGYYRPGECAPKLHYQVPLNAEAAVVQAGYVAGLYFVIP